jgi:SAM-dependent methyltransferase
MLKLYTQLADVYNAMYKTFINYEEEFAFYNHIRTNYHCSNVLEIGCGTGQLAAPFINNKAAYTGMDISEQMLSIAKENHPQVSFLQADMRDFQLQQSFDFCFAAARTVSYLITNNDVCRAFTCMAASLSNNGILCFDFIDASRFIPLIKNGYEVIHTANDFGKQYSRNSNWSINDAESFTFNWNATYFSVEQDGTKKLIGEDQSVLRTFTADDIRIFLSVCGMEVMELIDKPSYAFDTLVAVARKQ